ncbi:MAG: hypothetical protein M3Y91_09520 [Actinomycetota bacterium]|nr:hypothetical protein [Actinomycetota bacterium]
MGFMDRVRETATDVVASAQDGITKSQAKLDQAQAKRDAEEMFKVLGQAYYAHHAGRADLGLVEQLAAGMDATMAPIEARLGLVPFPGPPPPPGAAAPDTSGWAPPTDAPPPAGPDPSS